jgi:hypothetical protein
MSYTHRAFRTLLETVPSLCGSIPGVAEGRALSGMLDTTQRVVSTVHP